MRTDWASPARVLAVLAGAAVSAGIVLLLVVGLGTRPDAVTTDLADQRLATPDGAPTGTSPLSSADPSASLSPGASTGATGSPSASPSPSPSGKPSASRGVASGSATSRATTPATSRPRATLPGGTMATRMYGPTRSGLSWHSGFWLGGTKSTQRINAAGDWRGRPMDFVTAYPHYSTWDEIADPSSCVGLFSGFQGRIALGLPMLPTNRRGQWNDILDGSHDEVFRTVARNLVRYGFGDSAVRIGLEANGDWFPWSVTADTADEYKASFRRIVGIMRAEAPNLSFWYDLNVRAAPLPGTSGRADVLSVMYPGDDVVDGISMDHYDFYSVVSRNAAEFSSAMRPSRGVGLADAADFARKRGKGFAVPEWGLHAQQGAGDNPYFIRAMYGFFEKNRDVLVYENYFNEEASYIGASIWDPVQNPQSSQAYRELWGR